MGRISRRRVRKPTEQEVVFHLEGLNHISMRSARTREARIAKGLVINSYLEWFRVRRIAIYKDKKTRMWVLGWPSDF